MAGYVRRVTNHPPTRPHQAVTCKVTREIRDDADVILLTPDADPTGKAREPIALDPLEASSVARRIIHALDPGPDPDAQGSGGPGAALN